MVLEVCTGYKLRLYILLPILASNFMPNLKKNS